MGGLWARYTALFFVSYWELPDGATDTYSDYEVALQEDKDRLLESLRGTLVRESEVALYGRPGTEGMELELEMSGGRSARARFYVVDRKVFTIVVVGSAGVVSEDGERFLESFRVQNSR
jgi:hypothetical protein